MESPLQEQLVGLRAGALLRGQRLLLAGGQAYPELFRDLAGDVRLHGEDVGRLAAVLLAPHLRLVPRVDQLHADGEVRAALQDLARHDAAHVQGARDLPRVGVFALVAGGGAVRDDLHAGELREAADQAFADAVREVFLVRILPGVGEGQHGEGGDALGAAAEKAPGPEIGGHDRRHDDRGQHQERDRLPSQVRGSRSSLQRGDGVGDAREAIRGLAGQASQDRGLPSWLQAGHVDLRRRRRLLKPLDRDLDRALAQERAGARDHLVEHDTQRVLIGGRRRRPTLDLLRRHVGGGAGDLAVVIEAEGCAGAIVVRAALGQPEVGDDGAHVLARRRRLDQHHVFGLEIAVHDAGAVRGGEGGRHLPREDERVFGGEPPRPPETIGQGLAVQELHREEDDVRRRFRGPGRGRRPVAVHVEDPAHVGVGHLPGQVDLALELRHGALVLSRRGQDRLERDALVQLEVLRFVQLAHSTPGEEGDHAEAVGDHVTGTEDGRVGIGGQIGGRQFEDLLHAVPVRVTRVRRPGRRGRGATGVIRHAESPFPSTGGSTLARRAAPIYGTKVVPAGLITFTGIGRGEPAAHVLEGHLHGRARPQEIRARLRDRPMAGGGDSRPREARLERGEEDRRQDRLQVLERGAPQIGVGGLEGASGDVHRLALQGEGQEIEHVLADHARVAVAAELPLDRAQDGRQGDGELGMVGRERKERPPASEPKLEAGRAQSLYQAVPRQRRGAGLQNEGKAPAHDLRCLGIEQRVHELAGGAGPVRDQRAHHRTEKVGPRQQGDECADQQRIARRVVEGGANAREVAGSQGADGRDHRIRERRFGRSGCFSPARLGQGAQYRPPVEPAEALHGREVGQRVLGRRGGGLALAPEALFPRAPT
jgi:hypothetical protein